MSEQTNNVLPCELFVLNSKAGHMSIYEGLLDRLAKIHAAALMLGANNEDWSDNVRWKATANIGDMATECEALANAMHENHRALSEEVQTLEAGKRGGKS